jgi:hypothetical protein
MRWSDYAQFDFASILTIVQINFDLNIIWVEGSFVNVYVRRVRRIYIYLITNN